MTDPEDDNRKEVAKPSPLLQNLAAIAARAPGVHKRYKDSRFGTSFGAANGGKRLVSWTCRCGWTGAATELKTSAAGLVCPSCGVTGGLTPA